MQLYIHATRPQQCSATPLSPRTPMEGGGPVLVRCDRAVLSELSRALRADEQEVAAEK